MRDYEFRGVKLDNGEWIQGSLLTEGNSRKIVVPKEGMVGCMVTMYPVKPKTVGQYTGLKDKEDIKAFEDDIVKCHFANTEKSEHIGIVVYRDGKYQAQIKTGVTGAFYIPLADGVPRLRQDKSVYMEWFEVIGNIYDNPDLIEKPLPAATE